MFKKKRNRFTDRNVPYYKPAICELCQIWGHASTQSDWIHNDFPRMVNEFRNKSSTVKVPQKQQKDLKVNKFYQVTMTIEDQVPWLGRLTSMEQICTRNLIIHAIKLII